MGKSSYSDADAWSEESAMKEADASFEKRNPSLDSFSFSFTLDAPVFFLSLGTSRMRSGALKMREGDGEANVLRKEGRGRIFEEGESDGDEEEKLFKYDDEEIAMKMGEYEVACGFVEGRVIEEEDISVANE